MWIRIGASSESVMTYVMWETDPVAVNQAQSAEFNFQKHFEEDSLVFVFTSAY